MLGSSFQQPRKDRFLKLVRLDVRSDEADLRAWMRGHGHDVRKDGVPFYCSVDGFDADPRELWQIPSVIALCERAVATGMISLMALNLDPRNPVLWGAWDVYATANRLITPSALAAGGCAPTPRELKAFREVLLVANEATDRVLTTL
jgi:hypothetical protein